MFPIKLFSFYAIFSLLLLSETFGQGQLFTKEEADNNFGPVLESIMIDTDLIKNLMLKSDSSLMFNLINKELVILDSKRNILYSNSTIEINNAIEFHLYGIDIIQELFIRGGKQVTYVEKRKNVLSITNGDVTMEFATPCPPYCPD